jgi:hypothetical protein
MSEHPCCRVSFQPMLNQEFIRINVPQERLIRRHLPFCAQSCLSRVDHNEKLRGACFADAKKNQLRGVQLAL